LVEKKLTNKTSLRYVLTGAIPLKDDWIEWETNVFFNSKWLNQTKTGIDVTVLFNCTLTRITRLCISIPNWKTYLLFLRVLIFLLPRPFNVVLVHLFIFYARPN
jgi:hypothetical protein